MKVFFRGFILSPSIPLGNGGGLRCLPFPAFSVASPIPALGQTRKDAPRSRISPFSLITCKARLVTNRDGGQQDRMIVHYQCPRPRPANGTQDRSRDSVKASRAQPTPTPRVSHQPFACGRLALGKIPHVENFMVKSKPENALSRYYAMGRYLSVV